jgi:plastocyanin
MRKMLIAVTIVALVGTVGCGKSKKSSSSSTATTAAGAATTEAPPVSLAGEVNVRGTTTLSGSTVEINQDNFFFTPTFVKAAGSSKVTVKLNNNGSAPHTFTIDSLSVDQVVQPGQSATVDLVLPAGGTVAWYCRFHKSQGMQGAFVLPGSSGSGPATTNPSPSPQGSYNY